MKWHECSSCDAEFRVVSSSTQSIEFCPFCGDSVEDVVEDEEDYDFDD